MMFLFGNSAPQVRLVGPRVVLRPPLRRDAAAWMALRRESAEFLKPWEPTWPDDALTSAAFHRRRLQQLADWRAGSGYGFLIFRQDDGNLLGGITLSNVRRGVACSGSLGYWIGAPYARHGYMTEAVARILDFAFDRLKLHRVEAACLQHNEASRGLLLKCGFTQEGVAREYLKIDGRWQDHVTFAILRDDARPNAAASRSGVPGVARKK